MKGIMFRPELIQAIVEGKKTVTRRVIRNLETLNGSEELYLSGGYLSAIHPKDFQGWFWVVDTKARKVKPRYQVGETVYVKEAWQVIDDYGDTATIYFPKTNEQLLLSGIGKTNKEYLASRYGKSNSPMFMKAFLARYFIRIKDVRAERLQEIENESDGYVKEGYTPLIIPNEIGEPIERSLDFAWYEYLWDEINPEYPYQSNPRIWRYEFELVS